MFVLKNEIEKILYMGAQKSGTAVPTFWSLGVGLGMVRHSRATTGTGRAKVQAFLGSIFFVFLNHARTITYKTT